MRYPDECPVFDVDGVHRTGRPGVLMGTDLVSRNFMVSDDGEDFRPTMNARPLTQAARRLVRWMKGGAR